MFIIRCPFEFAGQIHVPSEAVIDEAVPITFAATFTTSSAWLSHKLNASPAEHLNSTFEVTPTSAEQFHLTQTNTCA
jgi:hypothetical protein